MTPLFTRNLRMLVKAHEECGLSHRKLVQGSGITPSTMSAMMTGRVSNPTFNTIVRLSEILWVPLGVFVLRDPADVEVFCDAIVEKHARIRELRQQIIVEDGVQKVPFTTTRNKETVNDA